MFVCCFFVLFCFLFCLGFYLGEGGGRSFVFVRLVDCFCCCSPVLFCFFDGGVCFCLLVFAVAMVEGGKGVCLDFVYLGFSWDGRGGWYFFLIFERGYFVSVFVCLFVVVVVFFGGEGRGCVCVCMRVRVRVCVCGGGVFVECLCVCVRHKSSSVSRHHARALRVSHTLAKQTKRAREARLWQSEGHTRDH